LPLNPYIGDVVDMSNVYLNRAEDTIKKKAKDLFRKKLNKLKPALEVA
jgi:hypothetical protein